MLTCIVDDAGAYGRVVKDDAGRLQRIVEARDATPKQKAIREFNTGVYCYRTLLLLEALRSLTTDNDQREYYLTDTIGYLVGHGHDVRAVATRDADEVMGINTVDELALAETLHAPAAGAMTMDRLFTPWRLAYVKGDTGKNEGCVFCDVQSSPDDAANYVLHRGAHWYVMLNRYPYNNGHLLLVLRRHASLLGRVPPRGTGRDRSACWR